MRRPAILSPTLSKRPFALVLMLLLGQAQVVALAGNDAPATGAEFVDTSFQCRAETSGTRDFPAPGAATVPVRAPCFYRLYTSVCDAPTTSGDVTRRSCRIESLMEFALNAGETRSVTKLPSGYHYCVSVAGPPALEWCRRNPMPQ